jgi:hypothetical protein
MSCWTQSVYCNVFNYVLLIYSHQIRTWYIAASCKDAFKVRKSDVCESGSCSTPAWTKCHCFLTWQIWNSCSYKPVGQRLSTFIHRQALYWFYFSPTSTVYNSHSINMLKNIIRYQKRIVVLANTRLRIPPVGHRAIQLNNVWAVQYLLNCLKLNTVQNCLLGCTAV